MDYYSNDTMITSSELTSLERGEGEWKNVQASLRRAFLRLFETNNKKDEKINELTSEISLLRQQLSSRPTKDEILKLIDTRFMSTAHVPIKNDIDELRLQLVDMKADMQRKVSTRYVDDALRRKVDRTEPILKNANIYSTQGMTELNKISGDLGDVKARTDMLVKNCSDLNNDVKNCADAHAFRQLQSQVNELYSIVSSCISRDQVDSMLSLKKIGKEIDTGYDRADTANNTANIFRIEKIVAEHERLLINIRLMLNDESFLNDDHDRLNIDTNIDLNSKVNTNASSNFASLNSPSNRNGNSKSFVNTGGGQSSKMSLNPNDNNKVFTEVRSDAILTSLYKKLIAAENDNKSLKKEIDNAMKKISKLEHEFQNAAGALQVETLAVILEEQKIRVDSIIYGSISIEPVNYALEKITKTIDEITSYLGLGMPGVGSNLQNQLSDCGSLIESLSKKVNDIFLALNRTAIKIETIDSFDAQIESRTKLVENMVQRIEYSNKSIEFTNTNFKSIMEMSDFIQNISKKVDSLKYESRTTLEHNEREREKERYNSESSSEVDISGEEEEKKSSRRSKDKVKFSFSTYPGGNYGGNNTKFNAVPTPTANNYYDNLINTTATDSGDELDQRLESLLKEKKRLKKQLMSKH